MNSSDFLNYSFALCLVIVTLSISINLTMFVTKKFSSQKRQIVKQQKVSGNVDPVVSNFNSQLLDLQRLQPPSLNQSTLIRSKIREYPVRSGSESNVKIFNPKGEKYEK